MNIVGEYADYIRGIIFTYASSGKDSDEIKGIVYDGTLYFIVNGGLLYEVNCPNLSKDLFCTFYRNYEEPMSFSQESVIIDYPQYTKNVIDCISIIKFAQTEPIYTDEDVLSDESFQNIISQRSTDGSSKYSINSKLNHKSFVMISKSLFKLNKPDKVSLMVYQVTDKFLLYKFIIYKKKFNLNVKLYLYTLDLY